MTDTLFLHAQVDQSDVYALLDSLREAGTPIAWVPANPAEFGAVTQNTLEGDVLQLQVAGKAAAVFLQLLPDGQWQVFVEQPLSQMLRA